MTQVPDEFYDEFERKGESFFEIAELLYTHPDHHFTQDQLAEKVSISNQRISEHTGEMVDSNWLTRQENQTTFAWDTDAYNPASTEGITAVKRFYIDFWSLLKKHSKTAPGTFAIMGFALILAAIVVFAFFVGFSLGIIQESSVPTSIFLVIAAGSFLTGVLVTFLSPVQAVVNRLVWSLLPENPFQNE